MCGPHRGRFRAVNLSASGSFVFLIGRRGDLFTRLYDFDISGHDPVFFKYAYEDQSGAGEGAPIQLPAEPWAEQPKIPGRITDAISIHKEGPGTVHRILRVEGRSGGETGYWERDVAAPRAEGWAFHATGEPLAGRRLRNPARDTSARGLGPGEDLRFEMSADGVEAALTNFNVYCSPARLYVREDGEVTRVSPAPHRRPAPAGARPRPRRRAAHPVRGDRRPSGRVRERHGPGDARRDRDRGARLDVHEMTRRGVTPSWAPSP